LSTAYYQAGAALDQAFRLRSEKWLLEFSECAMEHVMHNLPSPMTPGSLIAPELMELMAYDKDNSTPYFETLRAYLLHERDIPKTSEKLIIHRTTLLYRLKKIQSMLNVNLEDPWQRLYLTLSLWILENQKNQ
jgi:DNA-binding PucR family transcriptional regulator